MGELELAWRMLPNEFIAVTGTNGKTTTVEWIGHLHREAGLPVAVAGNVGTALSTLVGAGRAGRDDRLRGVLLPARGHRRVRPEAAVLLNLSPDHLDRHGSMEAYRDAKLQIFARQGNDDVAVAPLGLGIEDLGGCARRVCFGDGAGAALSARAGELWWEERPLLPVGELGIPGAHNRRNAMAAAAVTPRPRRRRRCRRRRAAQLRGRRPPARARRRARGRPVRQRLQGDERREHARRAGGARTRRAGAGDGPRLHLILGGRGKGQDFDALAGPVRATCVAVVSDRRGRTGDRTRRSPPRACR